MRIGCIGWLQRVETHSRGILCGSFQNEGFSVLSFSFGTNHSDDPGCNLLASEGTLKLIQAYEIQSKTTRGTLCLAPSVSKSLMSSVD